MSYISAVLWGVLCLLAMLLTSIYYIPYLIKRAQSKDTEASSILVAKETSTTDTSIADTSTTNGTADQPAEKKVTDDVEKAEHTEKGESPLPKTTDLTQTHFIKDHSTLFMAMVIFSSLFAAFCGYYAGTIASSTLNLVKLTLVMTVLAVVFVTDLELMIIPNHLPVVLIVGRIITIILEFIFYRDMAMEFLMNSVITIVIAVVVLLLLSFLTHGGIGMGDVKLFSAIGFLCGMRALLASLLFAFVVGALFSTVLLIMKKKRLKDVLPLGPCMLFGFGIAVLLSLV